MIVEQLKYWFQRSGMTQAELIAKTGLSRQTIHRFVNTSDAINSDSLERIAAALEVEIKAVSPRSIEAIRSLMYVPGISNELHPKPKFRPLED